MKCDTKHRDERQEQREDREEPPIGHLDAKPRRVVFAELQGNGNRGAEHRMTRLHTVQPLERTGLTHGQPPPGTYIANESRAPRNRRCAFRLDGTHAGAPGSLAAFPHHGAPAAAKRLPAATARVTASYRLATKDVMCRFGVNGW
jgi:hypothetical protein